MSKQYVVISCPAETYSGYGSRARDFVKATIEAKKDEWDVWIMSQRWGNTPWGYLDDHEEWKWMKKHLLPGNQLSQKPDVWMQITIPNEYQQVGHYNIGVTAGIETTLCDPGWLEGCNRMDLNLISSEHSKNVFQTTRAEQRDDAGRTVKTFELTKPIEVVFEGVDLNAYYEMSDDELPETDLVTSLDEIEENFAFLFVGHWLQGEIGEDRKNVGQMIKVFLETFKNKHNAPALVLKTSSTGGNIMDRTELLNRIDGIRKTVNAKKLPNIYLVHGELEECEINHLYNHPKIKSMINMTKGEGFGRPLLEFSVMKKPLIVSGWSGQLDFLNPEFVSLVPGRLTQVHPSAAVQNIILPESQWFSVDTVEFGKRMMDVWISYKKYVELAKRQSHYAKTNFSFDKMVELLKNIYNKNVKEQPKLVLPSLPKLKKID